MERLRSNAICALAVLCALLAVTSTCTAAPNRPLGQAIQFGIGNSFNLRSFGASTLAYQRFVGRNVAWRLSLGLDVQYDSGKDSELETGHYEVDGSFDTTEWHHEVSLSSEWLVYRGERVSVFYGGGPRISYYSDQDDSWNSTSSGEWRFRRHIRENYGIGLQGCAGVQWAATDWLVVHAEYGVRCMYLHFVDEYIRTETGEDGGTYVETDEFDRIELDSRGVRFGLSAYF